ncbi:T9SS type A sorting domain-containing protein [Emticicia sp. C21]|uniref:T9SS type A sorting domain-containing protein n=1 Tax=Emticicia sp. C21 TaxID=2302915 RepID=UPI001314BF0F|nr:T9SS type A sorting domain-containing protein [Emticicia sp. C21]
MSFWSDDNTIEGSICKGGRLRITCELIQNGLYVWKKNGEIIPNENKEFIYTSEAGVYTAEVQTTGCKYVSPKITCKIHDQLESFGITVYNVLSYPKQNEYVICDKGETFAPDLNAIFYGEVLYQWQKDGVDIEGATNKSFRIKESGIYNVRALQGECRSNSKPVKVTIADKKVASPMQFSQGYFFYFKPNDTLNLCENTNIRLSGFNNFGEYKWYKNNEPVKTDGKRVIDISESGTYYYETNMPGGCATSSDRIVVNFNKPTYKPLIQLSNAILGCNSQYLTLLNNAFFYNLLTNSDAPFTHSWSGSDGSKQSGWSVPINSSGSTTYSVTSTIGNCIINSGSFTYDIDSGKGYRLENPLLENGKINMCGGNQPVLRLPGNITSNYTIQWYKDNLPIASNPQFLVARESGKYHAIYTPANTGCKKYTDTVEVIMTKVPANLITQQIINCDDKLLVEKEDGIGYAWKMDGKLINGANSHELFPASSGNYSLVSNNGYCSYESNKIFIEIKGKSRLAEKNIYCENDTLKLKAPEGNSYLWQGPNNFSSQLQNPQINNINDKNSGFYRLMVSTIGCTYKDSVFITVNEKPEISIERADEYCLGKNITMIARVYNGYSYWLDPKGNVDKSPVLTIKNATRAHNGVYTATALTYNTGCATIISTEIKLNEGICKSIDLFQPIKNLCANAENELVFNLDGPFSPDEKFNLYYINSLGEKTFLANANKSPLKFKAINPLPDKLIIESSVSKVRSNIIAVRYDVISYHISRDFTQVCTGFSVPLRLDSITYRFDKIQWLKNNLAIAGANGYSYNATESGNYWVRVERNGCKSLDSDSSSHRVAVKIGEISKPYIGTYYATANVCNGYSVPLDMNWYRIINKKYQWQLNDVDIPNAVDSFYLAKQAGDYSLKVTQGTCEAISSKVRVTLNMLSAPIISSSPYGANQNGVTEICDGSEVTLSSATYLDYNFKWNDWTPKPIEGVRFQWQKDNIDIPSANNFEYKTKEEGTYRLKVFQGDCMAISATIVIKKGKPKGLNLYESWGGDCIGEKKSISVSINSGITSVLGCSIFKDNKFFKETITNEYFTIEESGNYHATIEFKIPNSAATCVLYSDTLKIAFKDKIINYNLAYNSSMTTCLDSIPITGMPLDKLYNPKYQWKFNGQVIPNDTTYILMAKQSGVYQLETKSSLGCVYESNPVKVEFNKLEIAIDKPDCVCYNKLPYLYPRIKSIDSYYTIDNTYVTKTLGYEWQFEGVNIGSYYGQGVTKSGSYTLIVKQGTCNAKATVNIEIIEIPQNLIPNQDSLFLCPKGSVTFSAQQGNFTYTWLKNNQLFDNNQTQTIKTASEGTYKVWIEKEICGVMSNSIAVKEKIILPTAAIRGNKELINGDSAKIKVDFTSLPPWTIKLTNNQEFTAHNTPFEFAVRPLQTTVYELASVKNDCGVGTVSGKAEIRINILGNEELAGAKIKLFPVPTQGICQLSVETVIPEKLSFQLHNVEGKMIMKSEETTIGNMFSETINLESLPAGIYLLKIKVGNKIVNRKIVKGN